MSTLLSLYDGSLKLTRFSLRSPLHRSSPQQSACSCHPVAILIIAAFFKQFLFVKNFSFDFENYSLHSLVPILLKIQIIIKKNLWDSRQWRKLHSGSQHPLLWMRRIFFWDLFINFFHICLEGTIGAKIAKQLNCYFSEKTRRILRKLIVFQ